MSTTSTPPDASGTRRGPGTEPPLGALALLATALMVSSVAAGAALGGVIPSPFGGTAAITGYFARHHAAVLATAVPSLAAVVPLTIFVGVLGARLRLLGIVRGGATVVQAAGSAAVACGGIAALATWVLSRPEVAGAPAVVRAVHDLAFAVGGPGFAIFTAVTITGVAGPARRTGILPRAGIICGFVVLAATTGSLIGLIWSPAFALLPVARFGGMAWLTYAGFALPLNRARRNAG